MAQHGSLTIADGVHIVHAFEYANAGLRAGASGMAVSDVGKIALQTDDGSLWRLTNFSPVTWSKILQQDHEGTNTHAQIDTHVTAAAAHLASTANPHSVTAAQAAVTGTPTNYTAATADVQAHLAGVDTALAIGGSDKHIQYNNSGVTGGHVDFQIDTTTGKLSAPVTQSDHVSLIEQASAPATPASGFGAVYAKTDSKLYFKDDAGNETDLTGGGGGTPGGSSGQLQYNDGASGFAGSAAKVSSAGAVDLPEIAAPSTPSSGFATMYAKADGTVNVKTDGGEEHRISPKQVAGVLVSADQDGAHMMRVAGRSAASGAGPSFDGGATNEYCFLMLVTPYTIQGPGANSSDYSVTRGYFTMTGGTGGTSGIYGGVTCTSATGWRQYRRTASAGTSTSYSTGMSVVEEGPLIVGQSQLAYGVSSYANLTLIGPGVQGRQVKNNLQENQMAQVDIGLGLGEAIIHSCGSVDCSSGNPFANPIHFKLCQRIWLKEGEFRDIASAEVGNLGAVTFYRRWIPGGITVSSGTAVNGWTEAGGNTGSDMTVEGGATPVKLTIDWGAK